MFSVKPAIGTDKVYYRASQLPIASHRVIRQCWFNMLQKLEKDVKRDINSTPKTGKTYLIRLKSGRKKKHKASSPGQAHANITRETRDSLSWKVSGTTDAKFGYGVVDDNATEWSKFLEFGNPLGNSSTARPSILRNIKNLDFESHFSQAARDKIEG